MKYAVSEGNVKTEFATYEKAEQYALSKSIPTGSIFTVEDEVIVPTGYDIYRQGIEQGYNIPNTPYYLGLDDADRAQFQGMLLLVNEALSLGLITTASMQSIVDKNNNVIPMSVLDFKQLMVGYGFYYKTLWDQKNN